MTEIKNVKVQQIEVRKSYQVAITALTEKNHDHFPIKIVGLLTSIQTT
jgi:LEA14-like dessication related protein